MNKTQIIDNQGKKVFFMDFSDLKSAEEIKVVIQEAQKYIYAQPPLSVSSLTTIEGTHFNNEIKDMFTEFVKKNKPYIKSSAVVGVTGLRQIMYNSMMRLTGRDTRSFDTMEQAKAWLAVQK